MKYAQNFKLIAFKRKAKRPRRRRPKYKSQLPVPCQKRTPSEDRVKAFYCSKEWATVRYLTLKKAKGKCLCCGKPAQDGGRLVVDHIKPLRHFWDLRLDESNLQVLCSLCNRGKGSWGTTDWRDAPTEELKDYYGIPLK